MHHNRHATHQMCTIKHAVNANSSTQRVQRPDRTPAKVATQAWRLRHPNQHQRHPAPFPLTVTATSLHSCTKGNATMACMANSLRAMHSPGNAVMAGMANSLRAKRRRPAPLAPAHTGMPMPHFNTSA
eukprot:1161205-Pelagomonas_calceolata.AAC.9